MGIKQGKWQAQLVEAQASGLSLAGVRRPARHQRSAFV